MVCVQDLALSSVQDNRCGVVAHSWHGLIGNPLNHIQAELLASGHVLPETTTQNHTRHGICAMSNVPYTMLAITLALLLVLLH